MIERASLPETTTKTTRSADSQASAALGDSSFAELFAGLRAHESTAGPTGIAQTVRDELKQANSVELDDLAAGELASPGEKMVGGASAERSAARPDPGQSAPGRHRSHTTPQAPENAHPERGATENAPEPRQARSTSVETSGHPSQPGKAAERQDRAVSAQNSRVAERAVATSAAAGKAASIEAGSRASTKTGGRVDAISEVGRANAKSSDAKFLTLMRRAQQPLFRVEKEQVPTQVSRSLASIIARGGGRLTLRLSPRTLGDVRVDVHVREGSASATFRAENQSARDLLKGNLDALRSALEQRGVRVERLEVVGPHSESADPTEAGARFEGKEPSDNGEQRNAASHRWSSGRPHRASAEADGASQSELEAEPGSETSPSVVLQRSAGGSVLRLDAIA